jgi:hypothetical protein
MLEGVWSPIYGKAAWIGKSIVHFDVFLLAGLGVVWSATSFDPRNEGMHPGADVGLDLTGGWADAGDGVKFGLDNVRTVLTALGDPHLTFPSVLVAGTNGKGSTCAMLERIYRGGRVARRTVHVAALGELDQGELRMSPGANGNERLTEPISIFVMASRTGAFRDCSLRYSASSLPVAVLSFSALLAISSKFAPAFSAATAFLASSSFSNITV